MKRVLCKYRLWLLMTAALAGSLSLSAQEPPPRPASDFLDLQQGVTEAELVTRALASNPTLLAQRQQIAMARGDVTQARLRQNPSLTLGGLKEVNGGDNAINVSGSLPLELFGRRARRTEAAESKEEATQQSVADQERLLAGEVRMRFGQALAAIRDLMFVEQLLQVNRDFLRRRAFLEVLGRRLLTADGGDVFSVTAINICQYGSHLYRYAHGNDDLAQSTVNCGLYIHLYLVSRDAEKRFILLYHVARLL